MGSEKHTEVQVQGRTFQLFKMNALDARRADLKVLRLLAPLLGALDSVEKTESKPVEGESTEGLEPVAEIKFEKVIPYLDRALTALPEDEFDALVKSMLKTVSCGSDFLSTDLAIDKALGDLGPLAMYELIFEIARFNKFLPFALLASGGLTSGVLGSLLPGAKLGKVNLDRLVS